MKCSFIHLLKYLRKSIRLSFNELSYTYILLDDLFPLQNHLLWDHLKTNPLEINHQKNKKILQNITLSVGLCFFSPTVFAIVDVTQVLKENSLSNTQKKEPLTLQMGAHGTLSSGNTENTHISTEGLVAYRKNKSLSLFMAQTSYGESAKVVDERSSLGHLRWVYSLHGPLYLESFYQIQSNTFQRLNLRRLAGMGLRYEILNNEKVFIATGLSAFYSEEDQDQVPEFNDGGLEVRVRGSSYLNLIYNFAPNLALSTTTYFQPVWNEMDDHRLSHVTQLEIHLHTNLKFNVGISVSHDNQPLHRVTPTDTQTALGLDWKIK